MRLSGFVLAALISCRLLAAADGVWKADGGKQPIPGEPKMEVTFPGGAQLYRESDRLIFRPKRAAFDAGELEMEVKVDSDSPDPVDGVLFFKDKDGIWFQSLEEFHFFPGEWRTVRVRLDRPGRDWRGVGHDAVFDAQAAATLFAAGISVYGDEPRTFTLECRNLRLTGKRERKPLAVVDWNFPEKGEVNRRVDSRFRLSREFFNPFDPDAVTVDYDLRTPDGKVRRYPGFYSHDYRRTHHFTREIITPVGSGFWEIRFTPPVPGGYRVRLVVEDRRAKEKIETEWRTLSVMKSDLPGSVRVSKKNPGYFELTDGLFFFPIGLNIHTNTDQRGERGFAFGHLPDRGTRDYDDYLKACGKAGIDAVEIWMAGWTFALEHDSSRRGCCGVGRYNTDAAWRLDHVIDTARRNGIYINLVIDNHGRISEQTDPEWAENPINSKAQYAVANGGFLDDPGDFFKSPAAVRNNSKRARYLAARWGGTPNIMAVELWSEVDLTANMRDRYDDKSIVEWHRNAAAELRRMSQLDWLVSTHVCGTYQKILDFIDLYNPPSITHLAGDGYLPPNQYFADHLRAFAENMKDNGKPQLITEYGLTPPVGSTFAASVADIHSGLWGSLFARLSGTPFLWWHDFVLLGRHEDHYRAFADYLKGIDLRCEKIDYLLSPPLTVPSPPEKQTYQAFALAVPNAFYGWIYNYAATREYPVDPKSCPEVKQVSIRLESGVPVSGRYRLRWFSTLPLRVLASKTIEVKQGAPVVLICPPFRIDIAFKLEREGK